MIAAVTGNGDPFSQNAVCLGIASLQGNEMQQPENFVEKSNAQLLPLAARAVNPAKSAQGLGT